MSHSLLQEGRSAISCVPSLLMSSFLRERMSCDMLFVLSGSFSCIGFFLRPVLTEHTLLFSVQRTRSLGIGLGLGSGGKGGDVLLLLFPLTLSGEGTGGGGGGCLLLDVDSLILLVDFLLVVLFVGRIGVTVHEKIDKDLPRLVTGELSLDLLDLTGEEPDGVGEGVDGFVVGGNGNINPVHWGVGITESDNGDVHVRSLVKGLVVESGIGDDHETGLLEFLGVLIGKGTGNPLSTEVVGMGVGGELQDGTLGVWSAGDDEDILGVLGLDGSDDSGGDHEFLPGLGEVDVENTFLVASEDVTFHHLGAIVGSNMDLSGEHVNEILVFVVSV